MRRLAVSALVFVLGAAALDFALGRLHDRLMQGVTTGQMGGLTHLALRNRDASIVVFGNSHARRHIDPGVLEEVLGRRSFNAGLDGQGIEYQRLLAALMLAKGARAEIFVLYADESDLLLSRLGRAVVLLPFAGEVPEVQRVLAERGPFERLKQLSRGFRYNSMTLPLLRNRLAPPPQAPDGFMPLGGRPRLEVEALPPPRPPAHPLPIREESLVHLRAFLASARAHDVRVVVMLGPELRRTPGTHTPATRAAIREITAEQGVPLLEFDEEARPEFRDPALYHDPGHLNARGAERLSRLLAESLRPWLEPVGARDSNRQDPPDVSDR